MTEETIAYLREEMRKAEHSLKAARNLISNQPLVPDATLPHPFRPHPSDPDGSAQSAMLERAVPVSA